ncbi:crAss001_48 related protein [Aeromonas caviae]|uniref:crAss001_48 related protein n=1 Tax=Aeromonas caviae TaxID=648 RepID=UPI003EC6F970
MTEPKLYQCHKRVHATPMTRGEYNALRGWELPANESPDDEGHLVIDNLGTESEHLSWSPKAVFDEGYTEVENQHLPEWHQRMLLEHKELGARVEALHTALYGGICKDFPAPEKMRLKRQLDAMDAYLKALTARVVAASSARRAEEVL